MSIQKLGRKDVSMVMSAGLIIFIFFVGICIYIGRSVVSQFHEELLTDAETSRLILEEEVATYIFGLQGAAGAFIAGRWNFDPKIFRSYAESRDMFSNFNGSLGFGFIRSIASEEFETYKKRMKVHFDVHPPVQTDHHMVIEIIEPIETNRPARGLNIAFEVNRREAAIRSAVTGKPALTKKISLVQNQVKHTGFLYLNPIYKTVTPPPEGERLKQLIGWTYTPIVLDQLLKKIGPKLPADIGLTVSLDNEENVASAGKIVSADPYISNSTKIMIRVGGEIWRVEIRHDTDRLYRAFYYLFVAFLLGDAVIVLSMLFVISALKAKDESLLESQLWFRALVDSAGHSVISTRPDGIITTFNSKAESILGYRAEEMIGKCNPGIFHDPTEVKNRAEELTKELGRPIAPGFETFVCNARESGPDTNEWTYIAKNGSRIPVRLCVSAIYNQKKEVLGFLGIAEDLTELKRKQKIIDDQERALNETAIIVHTDARGRITLANDNFTRISGYTREELIGKTHSMINSGTHPPAFFKEMWSTIRSKNVWRGEICNRAKNGSLYWVDSTIFPTLDPRGEIEGFIAIRYDITPKKQFQANFTKSSRLTALGEMAGGIAHEINNPLAIIQGKTEQLLARIEMDQFEVVKFTKDLETIKVTGERIVKIIHGLLLFARDGSNDPFESVRVSQVIDATINLCRERFRSAAIELSVGEIPDSKINCRMPDIEQVILSLLTNSFDAVLNLQERWVRVESKIIDDKVEISITDSGNGIPSHIVERLMQPFFTTKQIGSGTGLGLSTSKGIVESHGGVLYYDTNSKHTRFAFNLPIAMAHLKTA